MTSSQSIRRWARRVKGVSRCQRDDGIIENHAAHMSSSSSSRHWALVHLTDCCLNTVQRWPIMVRMCWYRATVGRSTLSRFSSQGTNIIRRFGCILREFLSSYLSNLDCNYVLPESGKTLPRNSIWISGKGLQSLFRDLSSA